MSYRNYSHPYFLRFIVAVCMLAIAPAHADEYTELNQLIRAEKLSEAMTKVDSYLASKPRDPQLRFLKGVIQRISGKHAEAISTFTKLTEDFPELPEPYNNLAVLYAGQSQFEKARSALEMAIRTNPSYATAHENLGDVYARLASQAYGSALQLEGANPVVPPKLALIKELFKSNLKTPPGAGISAAPSAAVAALTPATPAKTAPILTPVAPPVVAQVAVAASAPPVTVPTAAVPAAQPKPIVADKSSKEVESAVLSWAKAWTTKNMGEYLGAYSKEFSPPGNQSRTVWEQERKKRILGKASIAVKLENLSVSVNGNKATVKFRQDYKANALAVSSRKTLMMVKQGNEWLIVKETTGN
jgi:Flp pilus assembly protein TadD/ketosteroid isomerase-like protein